MMVYADTISNSSSVTKNNGIETITKTVTTNANADDTIIITVTTTKTDNKTGQSISDTKNYTV